MNYCNQNPKQQRQKETDEQHATNKFANYTVHIQFSKWDCNHVTNGLKPQLVLFLEHLCGLNSLTVDCFFSESLLRILQHCRIKNTKALLLSRALHSNRIFFLFLPFKISFAAVQTEIQTTYRHVRYMVFLTILAF